ncbi:MAG: asparagine synthase (glutamine-hydrolyzing), partial [Lachnospiraceae bacterium]|nr:asparagine synthase (glutamine-hydrolyzing) [Lachnospiraceae bacterium]
MCGIAGIAGYNGDPIASIEAMKAALIRRGPDSEGNFIDESRNVVIGHRRLSIIDLSETGAQPMISINNRYVIAFNGEIYNAPKLRNELEVTAGGVILKGTSDTEVLLEAIDAWGIKTTLEKSRGMWGISLYDRDTGYIYLSRDRMGEKPLYYGKVNGQFVWASDVCAIRAIPGMNNEIDRRVLLLYLKYGYIPAPYTIYKGIYKLEPGCILATAYPFNEWKISRYYNIAQVASYGQSHLFTGSETEAYERLEMLLKDALRGQMLSDVPLGAFLSGGIDSTTVVALMQQITPSDTPVRTFSIGFEEDAYNEAAYAAESARYLGTRHTEMYVGYKDVMALLPELSVAYGEPFADSSQLPTMLVSKMTREHVTVALSGDAGDELFCGYNTYKDAGKGMNVLSDKFSFLKGSLRTGAGIAVTALDKRLRERGYSESLAQDIHKAASVLRTDSAEEYYRSMNDDIRVYNLLPGDVTAAQSYKCANDVYEDGYLKGNENNLMLMDMLQYLPDDILCKVDRAGMYYSLETRIPLLDTDVVNFAWTLPLEYKMSDGITKKPLRNILYKYVPKKIMDRPKKGFSITVSEWLREGEMCQWAES